MSEIRVLPRELQDRIAAGEVIERPASVVKELIENSLDAGATVIEVDVTYGGRRLIRVSDNGRGMDRDDALMCFHPHATSKISDEEDLFNIRTLGFRGEALSSIASVSRLKILTSPSGSSLGLSVEVQAGELKGVRESAQRGTTVEVRDLFFNTPARMKFLKSRRTETYHIVETVTVAALSYPEVAFSLTVDRTETLRLPAASGVRERILQIYGEEFLDGLIEIQGSRITALVSREGNYRSSRANQYIFINGRPVRDSSLRHAVYSAYDASLPKDRHPIFFLYLQLAPPEVDFNVHPSKREVRFSDREAVYRLAYDAVREALTGSGLQVPVCHPDTAGSARHPQPVTRGIQPATQTPQPSGDLPLLNETRADYGERLSYIHLGDVFTAYTHGSGITLLDRHAAHERVLYERLLKGRGLTAVHLLFPEQVRLTAKEHGVLLQHLDLLRQTGIEAEDFGHNTITVRAVPDFLKDADMAGVLSDIAHCLIESVTNTPVEERKERIAKRIACHSSVRGPAVLRYDEVVQLLDDLSTTEDPEHCPHGRPTRIHIGIEDLKRMFRRTG